MDTIDFQLLDQKGTGAAINRLAAALGCSPEVFFGSPSHEFSQTLELLNLWLAIKGMQDRAKILDVLRIMSAKAQTPENNNAAAQVSGEPVALAHAAQVQEPDDGA